MAKNKFAWVLKDVKQVEKELVSNYQNALNAIKLKIVKFAEKSSLTVDEAFKFDRMNKLKIAIEKELANATKQTYKEIRSAQIEIFNDVYNYSLNEFYVVKNFDVSLIRAVIENPLYDAPFKDALKDLTRNGSKKIDTIIRSALTQGLSIPEITSMIQKALETTANHARLIAQTETLRAASQSQLEATDELIKQGFKIRKVWLYGLHRPGSRPEHIDLDGTFADEDGYFRYVNEKGESIQMEAPRTSNIASEDLNCTCSYINEQIE